MERGPSSESHPPPAESSTDSPASADADVHARYVAALTDAERQLIDLRVRLYNNSWDEMLADFHDRLKGGPYIFKLVRRIEQDIQSIQKLESYESKHAIDLHEFLDSGPEKR